LISPLELPEKELARILSLAGAESVSAESIQLDIKQGAPVNPDGTINLVHFTAWLVQQARG
jgi:hypothetical protein